MKRDRREHISDAEVEKTAAAIREMLSPGLVEDSERLGIDIEATIRYSPLQGRFEEERTARGLTIKEAAARLKVPQYRLRDIEKGNLRLIVPAIFHKYCRFLELDEYVRSWIEKNPALAEQMGISG